MPHTTDTPLAEQLRTAYEARGSDYQPRTHHLQSDGLPQYTNRLILEDSPYLIQHAHNPVEWYPWGPEAFERAQYEGKPIFLSIGYSTCHWCHVMEEESFDNLQLADYLNRHYIAIKVDREQRPDLDAVYMMAVTLLNGHGGWPMNSFLTPEGETIFGGTYYPPQQLQRLLERVAQLWQQHPDELRAGAQRIAAVVAAATSNQTSGDSIGLQSYQQGISDWLEGYDELQGGYGDAPKFPQEPQLRLLVDQAWRQQDHVTLAALHHTLIAMARGGMHDQVGGGFHRYSTDNAWLVPHFEKMLYNQAQLGEIYLDGWLLSGDTELKRVVVRTLDYVLRELQAEEGGFFSATDADSEGGEGHFFIWQIQELIERLGPEASAPLIEWYGMSEGGNFEGANIPFLATGLTPTQWQQLDDLNQQLYRIRQQRSQPFLDRKRVTAWNGMMIRTLAEAARYLPGRGYDTAALKAAEFIWQQLQDEEGHLWRTHLDGRSSVAATQKDYAILADALISLYDLTHESSWLQRARTLTQTMLTLFGDEAGGPLYLSLLDPKAPAMARTKESSDGATPAGNGVAVELLARLGARTGERFYTDEAYQILNGFSGTIRSHPIGYPTLLHGAMLLLQGDRGDHAYGAAGAVYATASWGPQDGIKREVTVSVAIRPGWHINAHQPLQKGLIPTQVSLDEHSGWLITQIDYPEPERVQLGLQAETLALYQGTVTIRLRMQRTAAVAPENGTPTGPQRQLVSLMLQLQACSDQVCLAPEQLRVAVLP